MRLVEIRLLEGPNVYRLEPAVKIEVVVGRRRTWYGQRSPGEHHLIRLGAPVDEDEAPYRVRLLAQWLRRLHEMSGAGDWVGREPERPGRDTGRRERVEVTLHTSSDPGHWKVVFPWREQERAEALAEGALRLVERGVELDAAPAINGSGDRPRDGTPRPSRTLARVLGDIERAGTTPPPWIRDEELRIPIVSLSGTNGKSTTTRMLTHIVRAAGRTVGTTTSDGVLIDEQLVDPGDWTGPGGALQVLKHPEVEVAVLETARGGMVLRGMSYESNRVSVLTNVSSDHLDLHGIHTLPELAEVKSVVARITAEDGLTVLNADDMLVWEVREHVRARVALFSLDAENPRVREHVEGGGSAAVLRDGQMVWIEDGRDTQLLAAEDAPATLLGLARHNIANALAAAAAARGLGIEPATIADGLRDYRPTADLAPGRLNLYRCGDRVVIVDFAHNEAGVDVLMSVAEGIARLGREEETRRRITAIVGTAGDRPDDTLRGVGRIAAQRADRIALKETIRYLRGRSRGSVLGELRAGMVEAGADPALIPVFEDEPSALEAMLARDDLPGGAVEPDAVVVLLVHEDRTAVVEVIERLGGEPIGIGELRAALEPAAAR